MNKILLVGFVCLSLGAFAQSGAAQGGATAQDSASGKASGQSLQKSNVIHRDIAARNQTAKSTTGKSTGNKSTTDAWDAPSAVAKDPNNGSNNGAHVATGDVNGDGHADLTAAKDSGQATPKNAVMNSGSTAENSRDAATGVTSGKRQHQPVTIQKENDAASTKTVTVHKQTDMSSPK